MRYYFSFLLVLWYAVAWSQTPPPGRHNSAESIKKPYVILISADGMRYDVIQRFKAKRLAAFRQSGITSEAMRPSYPSVTFPNHYSIVTGLYPSHHGIVDNTFWDPARQQGYKISDRKAVEDGSWYGGTPLWVLAEQQGMLAASYFWVGSEADIKGVRPSYYFRFNDKIPLDDRLRQVKEWLQLPEDQRPHFITFYFSQIDHEEHMHGINSKEAEEATQLVDGYVGRMVDMLDSLHLPISYLFVSDHGMADVDTVHGIATPAEIDTTKFRIVFNECMLHLYANDKKDVPELYAKLHSDEYDTYLPDATPGQWHYTPADDRFGRIGDILLVSKYPKVFTPPNGKKIIPGMHGFDNDMTEMGATFCAWGPAFKEQMTIAKFDNVHIYPLIAKILGLTITEPIDGRLPVLAPTLK